MTNQSDKANATAGFPTTAISWCVVMYNNRGRANGCHNFVNRADAVAFSARQKTGSMLFELNQPIVYSTAQIQRDARGHFFSADTMRFFASRVLDGVYQGPGGVYFVTSEKRSFSDYTRVYHVRSYDPTTGAVETAKGSVDYATAAQAKQSAKRFAAGERAAHGLAQGAV